jgi:SAM-dependent methyltransferase
MMKRLSSHPPYRFLLLKLLSNSIHHHVCHNLGLRSYSDLIRHLWESLTFDRRYEVSTRGEVPVSKLDFEDQIVQVQAVRYSPGPPFCIRSAFKQLKKYLHSFERVAFVDYGCGKGRVMLLALDAGFRQVIGLELSLPLVEQCRENLGHHTRHQTDPACFLVLKQNAATYMPPPAASVFFFFNPFSESLFDQVTAQIKDSIVRHPRPVYTLTLGSDYDFTLAGFKLIDQVTGVRLFCNT